MLSKARPWGEFLDRKQKQARPVEAAPRERDPNKSYEKCAMSPCQACVKGQDK